MKRELKCYYLHGVDDNGDPCCVYPDYEGPCFPDEMECCEMRAEAAPEKS